MKYIIYVLTAFGVLAVLLMVIIVGFIVADMTGNHIPENKTERIVSKNGYEFIKYHPDLREEWAYNKDFELTETCSTAKYANVYVMDQTLIEYTCDDITLGYSLIDQEITMQEGNDLYRDTIEVTPTEQKQNEELFKAEFSEDAKVIYEQYNS